MFSSVKSVTILILNMPELDKFELRRSIFFPAASFDMLDMKTTGLQVSCDTFHPASSLTGGFRENVSNGGWRHASYQSHCQIIWEMEVSDGGVTGRKR